VANSGRAGLRYGPTPLPTQLSRLKFLVNQLEA
jgi:hypothetical protein